MKYDFDEIIDRRNTNALSTDGFRNYLFHAPPTMEFPFKDEEFVRMWVADMEFATPPEIIDAMKARLDRRIFGYTQIFDPAYGEVFLQWTQRYYGWSFDLQTLVTSNGIVPALYELVGHICQPDEKVIIFTPSYGYFKHAADFNRIELVKSDLIDQDGYYTLNFEAFERQVKDEKVRLCIFCHPHNPTGHVWTTHELKLVGKLCLENDVWIISDEIHCDLLRNGITHTPMAKLFPETDRIITCMAPTKTFNMAGLMLSNVIIPNEELRTTWKQRHYSFENPISIAAVQAAYTSGHEWLAQLKTYLDMNFKFTRDYLKEHLPKAGFRVAEATYLAWINIGAYLPTDEDYCMFFANKAGVLLEGGDLFVANSDGYIRLNLACPKSILEEGLKRICSALNHYRRDHQ